MSKEERSGLDHPFNHKFAFIGLPVCSVSGATPLFWQPIILKCKAHRSENTHFSCSYFSDCQPSSWWGPLIGFLSGLRPNSVLNVKSKNLQGECVFCGHWAFESVGFCFQSNGLPDKWTFCPIGRLTDCWGFREWAFRRMVSTPCWLLAKQGLHNIRYYNIKKLTLQYCSLPKYKIPKLRYEKLKMLSFSPDDLMIISTSKFCHDFLAFDVSF